MKTFEHSPFADVYIPYIVSPDLTGRQHSKDLWESLLYTPLPWLARLAIYYAFKNLQASPWA